MRSAVKTMLCVSGVVLALMMEGGAQSPGSSGQSDPRVGLKGGLTDAAFAAKGLELVANLPKPEGFIDPSGNHSLNFANSDLAFQDNQVFLGNFAGFNIYDVENTRKPRVVTSIVCPGGPLLLRGHHLVDDADGNPQPTTRPITAVCRCERSATFPASRVMTRTRQPSSRRRGTSREPM